MTSPTGSCLHGLIALSNPRWEDFDYELLDKDRTRNRFFWLGDGETENEKYMKGDSKYPSVLQSSILAEKMTD